jgi:hypothetical protein
MAGEEPVACAAGISGDINRQQDLATLLRESRWSEDLVSDVPLRHVVTERDEVPERSDQKKNPLL